MTSGRQRKKVISFDHEPVHPSGRRHKDVARFPSVRFSGLMVLMVIGGLFVCRLSETGGKPSQMACLSAMAVSFLAAIIGLLPIYKVWGKDLFWVLMGVFLSSVIRLLIGFLGAVIIILFTKLLRTHFVGYLGLFYAAFLAIDTWLGLWILRNTKVNKDDDRETAIHGNIWDIISRHRKPA
jgi:hypothetical protein